MKTLHIFAAVTLAAASPIYSQSTPVPAPQSPAPAPSVAQDTSEQPRQTGGLTSFAPVVDKVAPSVVTIFTSKTIHGGGGVIIETPWGPLEGGSPSRKVQGLGSGVIVSADGLIITNNHVISGADEILVSVGQEDKEYKAKKVGADPGTDIAVLRIDAKNLKPATLADSDKLRPGDIVLAIGNPFGLRQTVTMGIVSAVGRGGMGLADYENFIQTDAAINAGNSGGALVDTQGRVVGINTAIYSRSGGNQGIGFAVPSNIAHSVMQSIVTEGHVVRGYLGTVVQPLTPDLAEMFKTDKGGLVADVEPDGPAAKAGLKSGDVITAVNGKKVNSARDLRLMISSLHPGTKVDLDLIRNGQQQKIQATLGEAPSTAPSGEQGEGGQGRFGQGPEENAQVIEGVELSDLDQSTRQQLGLPGSVHGVVVTDIETSSAAYTAGLRQGDVITQINQEPVSTVAMARKAVGLRSGKILLRVTNAKGEGHFIVIPGK